ncbi:uncharacterized protein LOC135204474 [Macrobrachium nipponense]|uniref:uncharacterized protein LOC135204474 n=1 Tax=Macrobrachium nipponense TaxID=159736 RepID=UPI0030C81BC3
MAAAASSIDIDQEFSDLECNICRNEYNEDHCPRILHCSHTFCSRCIDGLISAGKKECPICRENFTADSAQDVTINRSLLNVIGQLSSMHLGLKIEPKETKRSIVESTKHLIKKSAKQSIADYQATEAEAMDLLTSFSEMKAVFLGANEDIEEFKKTIEKLKLLNEQKVGNIDQCAELLGNKLELMLQGVEDIKVLEAKVTSVVDFASNGLLLDETGDTVDGFQGKIMELQDLVQKNKRDRENFQKEILKMRARFRNLSVNIEERIPADSREIFVVMTFRGKLRMAPVKIESNNELYMNHLQEGVLPLRCSVIKLECLMPGGSPPSLSPSPPPRAFLDLAYESTPLGRVIIRVNENGILALNFLYMCAGGMGSYYANSQVLRVNRMGEEGENVLMGEYVTQGGGGGGKSTQAVLLSREDWQRESQLRNCKLTTMQAGEVRGIIPYEEASQFWIVTRDHPRWRGGYCFGEVAEGLDVLVDAILKYPDITQVKVANCGLIL